MRIDWSPLWLSLQVAGLAVLASLGPALWLGRFVRANRTAGALMAFALAIPAPVVLYYLVGRMAVPALFFPGWPLAAAIVCAFPRLIRGADAALEGVKPEYTKAARSLGAPGWRVLWWIAVPLAWRGVCCAVALAFGRVLGELGLVAMLLPAADRLPAAGAALLVSVAVAAAGRCFGRWRVPA